MITEECLQRIVEMSKNKRILKRTDFIECGFKNHDIKPLLERGLIDKVGHGQYVVKMSLDDRFRKCIDLVLDNKYEEAKSIFKLCCKNDSKYIEELFKLILKSIESIASKNDTSIFKYIELALVIDDERYIRDIKFYLYLLNYIVDVPERYKKLINCLQYEDVELDKNDDRYNDTYFQNRMRYSSLTQKKFERKLAKTSTIFEKISIRLVRWCYQKARIEKIEVIEQIRRGNYEEVVAFLKRKQQFYGISKNEDIYLLLVQHILKIKKMELNLKHYLRL